MFSVVLVCLSANTIAQKVMVLTFLPIFRQVKHLYKWTSKSYEQVAMNFYGSVVIMNNLLNFCGDMALAEIWTHLTLHNSCSRS